MINNNEQKNNNTLDLNRTATLFNSSFEHKKIAARPLDRKQFINYFLMMSALPQFKKKNVLDVCPLYDLFAKSDKIIYEHYDCVDIDSIKIKSNKIFIHVVINPNLPLGFSDDIAKNIQKNAFANSQIFVKTTSDERVDYIKLEFVYASADDISTFEESELLEIYNSLKILDKNPDLQEKIKDMIEKSFSI